MSRLNYHHLYYFWRVANGQSLTKVAKELHISQSALSTQIQALEGRYGVQLFERSGRVLRVTDVGQQVLRFANDIFSSGEQLERLLHKGIEVNTSVINIGVLSHLSRNFVDCFIAPLLQESNLEINISLSGMTELLVGLANHEFDFILTNRVIHETAPHQQWQHTKIDQQHVAIVGPPHAQPNAKFPAAYEKAKWVLPAKTTEIRSAFDALCAEQQYTADVVATSDDMAMLRLLARDSGALSVLPPLVVRDEIRQGVLTVFEVLENINENFFAITLLGRRQSDRVTELLNKTTTIS